MKSLSAIKESLLWIHKVENHIIFCLPLFTTARAHRALEMFVLCPLVGDRYNVFLQLMLGEPGNRHYSKNLLESEFCSVQFSFFSPPEKGLDNPRGLCPKE